MWSEAFEPLFCWIQDTQKAHFPWWQITVFAVPCVGFSGAALRLCRETHSPAWRPGGCICWTGRGWRSGNCWPFSSKLRVCITAVTETRRFLIIASYQRTVGLDWLFYMVGMHLIKQEMTSPHALIFFPLFFFVEWNLLSDLYTALRIELRHRTMKW